MVSIYYDFKNYVNTRQEDISFYYSDRSQFNHFPDSQAAYKFNILEQTGNYLMAPMGRIFSKIEEAQSTTEKVLWVVAAIFAALLALPGAALKKCGELLNSNFSIKKEIIDLRIKLEKNVADDEKLFPKGFQSFLNGLNLMNLALLLDKDIKTYFNSLPPEEKASLETQYLEVNQQFTISIQTKFQNMLGANLEFDQMIILCKETGEVRERCKPQMMDILKNNASLLSRYLELYEASKKNLEHTINQLETLTRVNKVFRETGKQINALIDKMR